MALRTKVKVGNITNLSDARYCAGMGVDWLGFRATALPPKTFEDITGWITGPEFVMELEDGTSVESVAAAYSVDIIEIGISHLPGLASLQYPKVMVRLTMEEWPATKTTLLNHPSKITTIIFSKGLAEATTEDMILKEASDSFIVLLGFETAVDRIPAALQGKVGFNLEGTAELSPGLKDYQALADVLEKLEVD